MKLTHITITGADDETLLENLEYLTAEFPFVEWGVLVSEKRAGTPRYPSLKGVSRILSVGRAAMHLCGESTRRALAGDGPPVAPQGFPFSIQVNGFTRWVDEHGPLTPFGEWIALAQPYGTRVILQVQNERALAAAALLASVHPNVVALWDESGGRGIASPVTLEPPEGLKLGYAGGITPENVAERAEALTLHPHPGETWLDLESGVRTADDRLDLFKVRSVIEAVSPFVTRA